MRISMQRSELKEAISGLSRVMSRHPSFPALEHIRFSGIGRAVRLTATDREQTATYTPENATADIGPGFLVMLEALKPFTKGNNKDMLGFYHTGDNVIVTNPVGSQAFTTSLETMPVEEFPPDPPKFKTQSVDNGFLVNFQRLMTCASTDESRHILNGIHLDVSDKSHHLVATDGRRLMSFNTIALPIDLSCTVPSTKFLAWHRLAESGQSLSVGVKKVDAATWFSLVCQNWNYQVKAIDGTYPNWRQVVPKQDGAHTMSVGDEDSVLLMQTLPQFPGHDKSEQPIKLSGDNGLLTIMGPNGTNARLDLKASVYTGNPGAVTVNRQFFMDALKAGFRTFAFEEGLTPLTSIHPDGGKYLLMPLRTDEPVKIHEEIVAQATDAPAEEAQPADETISVPQPKQEEVAMEETKTETTALDRILAAFESAKAKLAEAKTALAEIADAVKLAVREQKSQKSEIENARMLLGKLQAVKL